MIHKKSITLLLFSFCILQVFATSKDPKKKSHLGEIHPTCPYYAYDVVEMKLKDVQYGQYYFVRAYNNKYDHHYWKMYCKGKSEFIDHSFEESQNETVNACVRVNNDGTPFTKPHPYDGKDLVRILLTKKQMKDIAKEVVEYKKKHKND
ncbi:MAG: hypothetical protein Pg6B_10360 [Candidatus Azobacteroides pseudotrichonymphae]|nr:MAG: hypothetical protein Pg6B_10360 [Candidatus Azobacteroides pseudotrichonymphae]